MEISKFLFKHRDKTGIPLFLVIFFFSNPGLNSFFISLPFLITGEFIRIWSLLYAGGKTRTRKITADILVTGGPYSYVRNPLYIGNFFNLFAFLVYFSPPFIFYVISLLLFWCQYYLIVREEEFFLKNKFKDEYKDYIKKVRRFFPVLRRYEKGTKRRYSLLEAIRFERGTLIVIVLLYLVGFLKMGFKGL